jgi:hypothetical protein|tara:strand:- start:24 stop:128 length:105 start_codon:yes stop_codon:yes gene_type:complete
MGRLRGFLWYVASLLAVLSPITVLVVVAILIAPE